LKDDNAISTQALKSQGILTVKQELAEQEAAAKREADPIGYYLKKFGLPVLLIGGGIYLASTYGKAVIKAKLAKDSSLNGFFTDKKLPGKSLSASQVLQLMDKDYDYEKSVRMVAREQTKGMSLNKYKKFKRKLENELKKYI